MRVVSSALSTPATCESGRFSDRREVLLVEPEPAVVLLDASARAVEARVGASTSRTRIVWPTSEHSSSSMKSGAAVGPGPVLGVVRVLDAEHVAGELDDAVLEAGARAEERPAATRGEPDAGERAVEAQVRASRRAPHRVGVAEQRARRPGRELRCREPLRPRRVAPSTAAECCNATSMLSCATNFDSRSPTTARLARSVDRRAHEIVAPPSTGIVWPVRYRASSDSRKHRDVARCLRAARSARAASIASRARSLRSVANVPPVIGVSTPPGQMQFARTPLRAVLHREQARRARRRRPCSRCSPRRSRGRGSRRSTRSSRSRRRRRSACGSACLITANVPTRFTREHVDEVVDRRPVRGLEIGTVEDAGRGDDAGDAPELASAALRPRRATAASSPTSHGVRDRAAAAPRHDRAAVSLALLGVRGRRPRPRRPRGRRVARSPARSRSRRRSPAPSRRACPAIVMAERT